MRVTAERNSISFLSICLYMHYVFMHGPAQDVHRVQKILAFFSQALYVMIDLWEKAREYVNLDNDLCVEYALSILFM